MQKGDIFRILKNKIIIADGGMGTMLQKKGIVNQCNDLLNLTNPDVIREIQKEYYDAGARLILTNTFGANRYKLKQYDAYDKLKEINKAAIRIAREAAPDAIIAGDMSELGKYMEPLDDLTFDEAYDAYKEQAMALKDADVLIIETMSDIKVLKAAVIAAKETGLPIITSMTFDNLRATTGTDVKTYTRIADSLGVDIIGSNCSAGPEGLYEVTKIITQNTNKPVLIKPNAGLPKLIDGKTVFDTTAEEFAGYAKKFAALGVNVLGGCCGTTPEFIKLISKELDETTPAKREKTFPPAFCSRTKTVELKNNKTLIVGERINPSGKNDFREKIKKGNYDIIRKEAISQKNNSANLLDINLGIPGTDEPKILSEAVSIVQNSVDLPIVIDTTNTKALEDALKKCDGKPIINSVNGDSIDTILPLAKKYGASIIALCLDNNGIPKTKDERLAIAKKIINAAEKTGIAKTDIIIDPLTMTIATNPENEQIILDTVKEIKELGYNSILGVSNISFGLPNRSEINSKFLTKAKEAGLGLAIIDPSDNIHQSNTDISIEKEKKHEDYSDKPNDKKLYYSILYGDVENIMDIVKEALVEMPPLKVNDYLLSGLEEVGVRFKNKTYFLPQVIRSADAMKKAFVVLKKELQKNSNENGKKIVFATVENDIHDIGKNIVISILESYGYDIIDLGKNVPLDRIINEAISKEADMIALSALMTTTAPEMEKIIKEIQKRKLSIPVIIGGAVVTEDYAKDIGAAYSPDAMGAVKIIKRLLE